MEGPLDLFGVSNCAEHVVDPNETQGVGQLPTTAKSGSPQGYALLLTVLHVDLAVESASNRLLSTPKTLAPARSVSVYEQNTPQSAARPASGA